jgi:oligoribonuclease NrnB/cAMP/cGMP phosphodiesterase (DHH superfamily)
MIANLTHFDLDGVVSHILLLNLFPDKVRYYACGYGTLQKKIDKIIQEKNYQKTDILIITDLVVNVKNVKILSKYFDNIFYFDHHESSLILKPELKKYIKNIEIKTEKCGAQIVFDCFEKQLEKLAFKNIEALRKLVYYTNIFDTWQTENKDFFISYYLSQLFFMLGWQKFVDRYQFGMVEFRSDEKAIIKQELLRKKDILNSAEKYEFGENAILITSENANEIINESTLILKNYDIYFIFIPKDNKVSVRVKNIKTNLGNILQKLDGNDKILSTGGHSLAGGFVLNNDYNKCDLENIINFIYEEIIKDKNKG